MKIHQTSRSSEIAQIAILTVLLATLLTGCDGQAALNSSLLAAAKKAAEEQYRERTDKVDLKNLAVIERERVCGEIHIKTNPDIGYHPFTYIPITIEKPTEGAFLVLYRYGNELEVWCKGWKPETPIEVLAAQEAVKLRLKDPESAQFRNVKSTGYSVCGEVNAKNGYGGYSGYTRFTYTPSDKSTTFEEEAQKSSISKSLFEITCANANGQKIQKK